MSIGSEKEFVYVPSRFNTFLQAGFECSTHRLRNGRRLDLIASTGHDVFIKEDYRRLSRYGIGTVREGLRWHLIEQRPGKYSFSSMLPLLDAAQELGIEQIVDLFHFGWPDHIDIFKPEFIESFTGMAFEFACLLRTRGQLAPKIAVTNEISFVSWGGGDVACIDPYQQGRGHELKLQLVRAAISAAKVFKGELPKTLLVWPEPVIHIAGDPSKPGDEQQAESYRRSMYQAWDMLSGRIYPELGGTPELLGLLGANFYERNQRMNDGRIMERWDPFYRPFHGMLLELWDRYHVPIFISETGAEDVHRASWFAYVSAEVRRALSFGIPVEGICLYPILNHPGWEDDRHCHNALFDYPDVNGQREVYEPLAMEIRRQQHLNSGFTPTEYYAATNNSAFAS